MSDLLLFLIILTFYLTIITFISLFFTFYPQKRLFYLIIWTFYLRILTFLSSLRFLISYCLLYLKNLTIYLKYLYDCFVLFSSNLKCHFFSWLGSNGLPYFHTNASRGHECKQTSYCDIHWFHLFESAPSSDVTPH